MKEVVQRKSAQFEPGPITESIQRAEAKAKLQRALDSMARLRRTIDRRPMVLPERSKQQAVEVNYMTWVMQMPRCFYFGYFAGQ